MPGQQEIEADERGDAEDRHGPESGAPAGRLAKRGAERNTEDIGEGQAREHQRHRLGAAMFGHQ